MHGRELAEGVSSKWEQFAREFPNDRRLEGETLYALPQKLLAELVRHAPGFLSPEDVCFEKRLRALAATGFWRRLPIYSDILDGRFAGSDEFPDDAVTFDEDRGDFGVTRLTLADVPSRHRRKAAASLELDFDVIRRGYAAWLVTNPAFQSDLARLKRSNPPIMGHTLLAETFETNSPALTAGQLSGALRFAKEWQDLREKWFVTSLVAWELPEPTSLSVSGLASGSSTSTAGIHLAIPWWMRVESIVQLPKPAFDRVQRQFDLSHINDWLAAKDLGPRRFSRLLDLYWYRDRIILDRYREQSERKLTAIKKAFVLYWEPSRNSQRDLSQGLDGLMRIDRELKKRIESCETAVSDSLNHWDVAEDNRFARLDWMLEDPLNRFPRSETTFPPAAPSP